MNNRIKEIREKQGMTAQKLAKTVDASWGQLFQLENGLRVLDEYWAARIAEALGCSPSDLMTEKKSPPSAAFAPAPALSAPASAPAPVSFQPNLVVEKNASPSIGINVVRLPHAKGIELPAYATEQSAGVDLVAAIEKDEVIAPGARALIPAGIAMQLPQGYEAQVRPRSGLALKNGVTVLNSPGTIDADYRGEIKVILINHGQEPFTVTRGSRIAQLVVAPVSRLSWTPVESLETSVRAEGGFGSTGVSSVPEEKQTLAMYKIKASA